MEKDNLMHTNQCTIFASSSRIINGYHYINFFFPLTIKFLGMFVCKHFFFLVNCLHINLVLNQEDLPLISGYKANIVDSGLKCLWKNFPMIEA